MYIISDDCSHITFQMMSKYIMQKVKIFQITFSEPVNINMSLVLYWFYVTILYEVKTMARVWKSSDKFYKPSGLKYEIN